MALPILDGNQSATTLSTILSSGQHIPAHTVVSLGTQAITDMRSAVSGSVVSISNLPSTQTIAGTVTANLTDSAFTTQGKIASTNGGSAPSYGVLIGFEDDEGFFQTVNNSGRTLPVNGNVSILGFDAVTGYSIPIQVTSSGSVFASLSSALPAGTNRIGVVTIGAGTVTIGAGTAQIGSVTASISGTVPVSISSVTIGNSVTIGSLPAISGTVTANIGLNVAQSLIGGASETNPPAAVRIGWCSEENFNGVGVDNGGLPLPIQIYLGDTSGNRVTTANPLPISGTVTIGNTVTITGTVTANPTGTQTIAGSVTLGAGTAQIGSVTASISNSVTIASFATSVTARLINPAGTSVTYAEVGTAGSPSIDVLSVQGVSGGTSLLIGGTTGSFTTRFGSVTTASTAQISTAVTNLSRKYLFVQNVTTSSNVITVGIGFTPTTTQGIQLAAGALIDFESSFIPTGAVYILSSVTGSPFTILEA